MCRECDEGPAAGLLKRGLEELSVPEVSAGFDARIHAALQVREPWWRALWISAQPALAPAGLSLAVTLLILMRTSAGSPATPAPQIAPDASARAGSARIETIDQRLDRLDLSTASLAGLWIRTRIDRSSVVKQAPAAPSGSRPSHRVEDEHASLGKRIIRLA